MELEKIPWPGHGSSMELIKIPWNINKVQWNLKKFHGMAMELKLSSMELIKIPWNLNKVPWYFKNVPWDFMKVPWHGHPVNMPSQNPYRIYGDMPTVPSPNHCGLALKH